MTWQIHPQSAPLQTEYVVSIQYHHLDSRHSRTPTHIDCQYMEKEGKIFGRQIGRMKPINTSTFFLLCIPKTDPMRCDKG